MSRCPSISMLGKQRLEPENKPWSVLIHHGAHLFVRLGLFLVATRLGMAQARVTHAPNFVRGHETRPFAISRMLVVMTHMHTDRHFFVLINIITCLHNHLLSQNHTLTFVHLPTCTLGYWHTGALVHWPAGTLACWHTGPLSFWPTFTLAYFHFGLLHSGLLAH